MGLLSTPLRMAQLATGVALLGGEAALRTGRNVAGAVVDVALAPVPGITALASDAAGMVVEALSGPPVRRTSSQSASSSTALRKAAQKWGSRAPRAMNWPPTSIGPITGVTPRKAKPRKDWKPPA